VTLPFPFSLTASPWRSLSVFEFRNRGVGKEQDRFRCERNEEPAKID
jgi:hypothetical protein